MSSPASRRAKLCCHTTKICMYNYNHQYYQKLCSSNSSKFWENSAHLRSVNLTQRDTQSIFIHDTSRSYSHHPLPPPWISRLLSRLLGRCKWKHCPRTFVNQFLCFVMGFPNFDLTNPQRTCFHNIQYCIPSFSIQTNSINIMERRETSDLSKHLIFRRGT